MTKRKETQKTKKRFCLIAEQIENEAKALTANVLAENRKEWKNAVALAGGPENMRLNAKPPKCRKKSPPAFKTVERRPWITTTVMHDGVGGKLHKVNGMSLRQGLKNLPPLGFSYTLGKWSKLT